MKKLWKILRRKLVRMLIKSPYDMAHYLCRGNGLEIGAMSSPYLFGKDCSVKYADIGNAENLEKTAKKIPFSGLYDGTYVAVDYILRPPQYGLELIPLNHFDFIYSSNSLEHTPNPIWALSEQIRVVKPGGIIYVSIPNKSYTYDKNRLSTSLDKIIKKFEILDFQHTLEEAKDVILNTIDHPLYDLYRSDVETYANKMISENEGIHHFFVFDEKNTLGMLQYISKTHNVTIEYFSAAKDKDINFALRKSAFHLN